MTNYEDTRFNELDLISNEIPIFNGQDERSFPFSAFYIDFVSDYEEKQGEVAYEQLVVESLTKR